MLAAVIPPADPTQGKPAVRAAALAARDALSRFQASQRAARDVVEGGPAPDRDGTGASR